MRVVPLSLGVVPLRAEVPRAQLVQQRRVLEAQRVHGAQLLGRHLRAAHALLLHHPACAQPPPTVTACPYTNTTLSTALHWAGGECQTTDTFKPYRRNKVTPPPPHRVRNIEGGQINFDLISLPIPDNIKSNTKPVELTFTKTFNEGDGGGFHPKSLQS